jgi:hypothetical protein
MVDFEFKTARAPSKTGGGRDDWRQATCTRGTISVPSIKQLDVDSRKIHLLHASSSLSNLCIGGTCDLGVTSLKGHMHDAPALFQKLQNLRWTYSIRSEKPDVYASWYKEPCIMIYEALSLDQDLGWGRPGRISPVALVHQFKFPIITFLITCWSPSSWLIRQSKKAPMATLTVPTESVCAESFIYVCPWCKQYYIEYRALKFPGESGISCLACRTCSPLLYVLITSTKAKSKSKFVPFFFIFSLQTNYS